MYKVDRIKGEHGLHHGCCFALRCTSPNFSPFSFLQDLRSGSGEGHSLAQECLLDSMGILNPGTHGTGTRIPAPKCSTDVLYR